MGLQVDVRPFDEIWYDDMYEKNAMQCFGDVCGKDALDLTMLYDGCDTWGDNGHEVMPFDSDCVFLYGECIPESEEVDASYADSGLSLFVDGDVSLCGESDGAGVVAYHGSEIVEATINFEFVLVDTEPSTGDPSTFGCTSICDVGDEISEIDALLNGSHVADDETMPLTGADIVEMDAISDSVLDVSFADDVHGIDVGDLTTDSSLAVVDSIMPVADDFMVDDALLESLWPL